MQNSHPSLRRFSGHGFIAPRKIAKAPRTTSEDVARSAGLRPDAVQSRERIRADETQRRLRDMLEILNKVTARFGSVLIADAWYRSEPLPGFSGQTAIRLVLEGRPGDVLAYLDAVDAGIHA